MTTINNGSNDQQLELGFNTGARSSRLARRERRLARASWWFSKMRAVVDAAVPCATDRVVRPEQTFLPGAYRQVRL